MNDMIVAQPINGSRGATVAGPRNIPLEAQVPDIFSAPLTDHGSIPNLRFSLRVCPQPPGGRRLGPRSDSARNAGDEGVGDREHAPRSGRRARAALA